MKKGQPVTLCGETLSGPLHICAFFESREEQYEILLPWIKEGIENNEEVLTILETDLHEEHRERISKANIPLEQSLEKGQLKIVSTEDTYLQGGAFAVDRMYGIVEEAVCSAENGPYGKFRGCGDMVWALKNLPGTDELMEYEAKLNMLMPQHECTILCAYDINKFSGRAVADILATHSHVIMNGRIHRNPHYMNPIDMLEKLIKRPKRPLAKSGDIN